MDELSKYKRSVEEVDMREKQLAAMRVDICSSVALKKLKGTCFIHLLPCCTATHRSSVVLVSS